MLTRNAVALLKSHATVEKARGRYRASILGRGAVITFEDRLGHVTRLRLHEPAGGTWSPRSVSAAVRSAMTQGKTVSVSLGPLSGLLVSVSLGPRSRSFESVSSYIVMDLTGGPNHMAGANDDWNDPEAVQMAIAVIEGRTSGSDLVNWLVERGGQVARLLPGRSQSC